MTLNKGLLTATVLYFGICGASFAQDVITTSNQLIEKLEFRKPHICRQVPANERSLCETLFDQAVQAARTKVARYTKGDLAGFHEWKDIQHARIDELLRRYGHLQVPTSVGASLVK